MDTRGPQEGAPVDPLDISLMDNNNKTADISECWSSNNILPEHQSKINNNRLLFLTVEYDQSRDFSKMFPVYEQVTFSPRANSPLSDFEHRVSPLDPNMSSAACYSPTPVQLPQIQYQNSVVVLQDPSSSPLIVQTHDTSTRENINFISPDNPREQANQHDSNSVVVDNFVDDADDSEQLVSSVAGELILMQGANPELETAAAPLMLAGTEFALTRDFLVMHDDQLNVMTSLRNSNEIIPENSLAMSRDLIVSEKENIIDQSIVNIDDIYLKNLNDDELLEKLSTEVEEENRFSMKKSKRQINDKKTFRCDDCDSVCLKAGECNCHNVCTIADQPVPSRAIATLPGSYLSISKVQLAGNVSDEIIYGVFAKRNIRRRTQFGPIEGIVCTYDGKPFVNALPLLYETDVAGEFLKIDVSNENSSNWMRFVRPANNYKEQNLIICQQNDGIVFLTTKNIAPNEELKAGPSLEYAINRNLAILEPEINENIKINNNFNCHDCNECFESSEDLKNHLKIHNNTDKSTTTTTTTTDNNKLFKIVDGQTLVYTCPHCSKVFPRSYSLKRHMIIHKDIKVSRYECSQCGENFVNSQKRLQHMKIFHKGGTKEKENARKMSEKWKCSMCYLEFDKSKLLNIHSMIHDQQNIIENQLDTVCPQCNIELKSRNDLIKHVTKHHGQQYEKNKIKTSPIPSTTAATAKSNSAVLSLHKCKMCYKRFATKVRLQQHYLVHGADDKKPLPCNICLKRFMNNSALSCHLKTHREDKQIFECPMCRKLFDQVLLLKDHIETHRNEDNTFNCPHCLNKKFTKYSVIRKHILAYHCEKKHKCQYCIKTFPTIDKLRMHLLRHSDYREFKCNECYSQFKRKDKLKEHMTRMHNSQRIIKREQQQQIAQGNNNNINNNNNSNIINNNVVVKKFIPKVNPTDYNRFIYKCHQCLVGFKRRGMLVNHLAKRHPDVLPESIPELNLPILRQTRDYYCQYCEKVYKSSSKRKAHIMKNHPGFALPPSNRQKESDLTNSTYCQTVGSITTEPHQCQWCHKQYASKAKLLQHQRKKHSNLMEPADQVPRPRNRPSDNQNQPPTIIRTTSNYLDDDDEEEEGDEDDDSFIKGKIIKIDNDNISAATENIIVIDAGGGGVRMRDIR